MFEDKIMEYLSNNSSAINSDVRSESNAKEADVSEAKQ